MPRGDLRGAVDGEVERFAGERAVERPHGGVQERDADSGRSLVAQDDGVRRDRGVDLGGWDVLVVQVVDLAGLDVGDVLRRGRENSDVDRVGEPVGLRGAGPLVEVPVAGQQDAARPVEGAHLVGAGAHSEGMLAVEQVVP